MSHALPARLDFLHVWIPASAGMKMGAFPAKAGNQKTKYF